MTGDFGVGVHALVYLNHKNCYLSSEQLAENICTNPARVRKIMALLRQAGLVETKEGGGGGYFFALQPQHVTLRQVAEAVNCCFASVSKTSGSIDMECQIASGMGSIMEEIYHNLNEECYKQLEHITIKDIDTRIFT